jgi:hypothetical protein
LTGSLTGSPLQAPSAMTLTRLAQLRRTIDMSDSFAGAKAGGTMSHLVQSPGAGVIRHVHDFGETILGRVQGLSNVPRPALNGQLNHCMFAACSRMRPVPAATV